MRQRAQQRSAWTVLLAGMLVLAWATAVRADSPPNPRADIPWQAEGDGVAAVEEAFNNGRRAEEAQLGLPPGALGTLDLPGQAAWDALSDPQKALYLMNAERAARGSSGGNVLGLGFTAVQEHVQALAGGYAQTLVARNAFTHVIDGQDPFQRIAADPVLGPCSEFLGRAENLALLATSGESIPLYLEQALYHWIYVDAGSRWGHRETVLLQDRDLEHQDPLRGFKNNVSSPAHEGFIGLGVVHSHGGYNPLGWPDVNYSVLVVLELIDPLPESSCPWGAPPPTPTPQPTAAPLPANAERQYLPLVAP